MTNLNGKIIRDALYLPAANCCNAHIVQSNYSVKLVDITPEEFERLGREVPVKFWEPGYYRFDVEAQLETEREYQHQLHQEQLEDEADFLAMTGRM